jgi:hypothetical protein
VRGGEAAAQQKVVKEIFRAASPTSFIIVPPVNVPFFLTSPPASVSCSAA